MPKLSETSFTPDSIGEGEIGKHEGSDGEASSGDGTPCVVLNTLNLKFATHYHPHVCDFVKALNRYGVPGLLTLANQQYISPGPRFFTTSADRPDDYTTKGGYQVEQIACYVFDS